MQKINLVNGKGTITCPSCNITIPIYIPAEQQRITPKRSFMFPNDQTSYTNILSEQKKKQLFAQMREDAKRIAKVSHRGYSNLEALEGGAGCKNLALAEAQRKRGFIWGEDENRRGASWRGYMLPLWQKNREGRKNWESRLNIKHEEEDRTAHH